jgi:serine/threonine protein phosphatase PrpC
VVSEAVAATAGSRCPVCGAPTEPDDQFCEVCGTPLGEQPATATGAAAGTAAALAETVPPSPVPAPTPGAGSRPHESTPTTPSGPYGRTNPCVNCGAPPTAIDTDGYCTVCGRRQPGPREHLEVDLGWAAGVTDRGRQHPRNEDAFHLELVGPPADHAVVAVVCDGVSSSVRAEEAAEAAAQSAATVLAAVVGGPGSLADATVHAADAATKAVTALPWTRTEQLASPSCTLVSAAVRDGEVVVGWVGDSRAYWIDFEVGSLRQLTADDSWAEAQIEAGRMTEAEADADPRSHAITRWIGADAPVTDAHVTSLTPTAAGRLLLCSDGLWNYAPTVQAMADLLAGQQEDASPLQLAQALTDFARAAGGHDNITVVVIDLPAPEAAPAATAEKGAL